MEPGIPLAFLAGALSFSSPCCLPLLPGYLGFVSGISGSQEDGRARSRVLLGASLFVAGFTLVFTALGASASVLGQFLVQYEDVFLKLSGVFIIAVGAMLLVGAEWSFLIRERRAELSKMPGGPVGAMPLGMAFAFGWTPCIGPVLAALLTYAGTGHSLAKGAGLLFVYSLGLGLPFLLAAMGFQKVRRSVQWFGRHAGNINRLSGLVLIAMGLMLITGSWIRLFAPLIRWYGELGWPPI